MLLVSRRAVRRLRPWCDTSSRTPREPVECWLRRNQRPPSKATAAQWQAERARPRWSSWSGPQRHWPAIREAQGSGPYRSRNRYYATVNARLKLAIFVILLMICPVLLGFQAPPRPKRPGVADPAVRIPMTRLKPDQVFEIPGVPDWIAIDDHVWISNSPKHSVTRIDPKANKIVETIAVGKNPCSGLTAGFGSLWVPNCGDPSLSRVDLKTAAVTATLPLTIGNSEGGLTTAAGSVWLMTDAKGTLARIDPATNK